MPKIIISKPFEENVIREMTSEEVAEFEKESKEAIAENEAFKTKLQAKADLKASAKAKLIAGEALTEAEADTIVL